MNKNKLIELIEAYVEDSLNYEAELISGYIAGALAKAEKNLKTSKEVLYSYIRVHS